MFVKNYIGCLKYKPIPQYYTTLPMPLLSLPEASSIDFSGPHPTERRGEKYPLISVEHVTGWPIARCTKRDNSDVVQSFVLEKSIFIFETPEVKISDKARCFLAVALQQIMKKHGISWKKVCSYTPMSNWRVERIVVTIRRAIKESV